MKSLLLVTLVFSGAAMATGGGGGGGYPGPAYANANSATHCYDVQGKRIKNSAEMKKERQCPVTGNDAIDLLNYNNFYGNKPKGETLSMIRSQNK